MRINYQNYKILKFIKDGTFGDGFYIDKDDEAFFNDHWAEFLGIFTLASHNVIHDINYISSEFSSAAINSTTKIYPLFSDIIGNNIEFNISSVFIMKDFVLLLDYHQNDKGKIHSVFMVFDRNGCPISYVIYANDSNFDDGIVWVSKHISIVNTKDEAQNFARGLFQNAIVFYMFKRYAQVEIKILEPKRKIKDVGCKYLNETDFTVTHLDSKWFTTLVKSDSFKVRGHFRLQACGPSYNDRKLVWINDFMKEGYTAKAKILTQTCH